LHGVQGDQKIRKKSPNFSKNSPESCEVKKRPKYPTTKLNLNAQNIYIKQLLKSCFETAHLGKNVIILLKQKVAQKCHYFGLLHPFKKS
jgi:hypothetical protein